MSHHPRRRSEQPSSRWIIWLLFSTRLFRQYPSQSLAPCALHHGEETLTRQVSPSYIQPVILIPLDSRSSKAVRRRGSPRKLQKAPRHQRSASHLVPIPIPSLNRTRRSPTPVVIRFKSVGSAPIMKQNFFKITASHKFQAVVQFLRKELRWKAEDPLVCTGDGKPKAEAMGALIAVDSLFSLLISTRRLRLRRTIPSRRSSRYGLAACPSTQSLLSCSSAHFFCDLRSALTRTDI